MVGHARRLLYSSQALLVARGLPEKGSSKHRPQRAPRVYSSAPHTAHVPHAYRPCVYCSTPGRCPSTGRRSFAGCGAAWRSARCAQDLLPCSHSLPPSLLSHRPAWQRGCVPRRYWQQGRVAGPAPRRGCSRPRPSICPSVAHSWHEQSQCTPPPLGALQKRRAWGTPLTPLPWLLHVCRWSC